jgi:hypothetical protein
MREKCICNGAELLDSSSGLWVHGDLFELGDCFVFNAVLNEHGEAKWDRDDFRPGAKILQLESYFFERRGVIVVRKDAARMNPSLAEYVGRYRII